MGTNGSERQDRDAKVREYLAAMDTRRALHRARDVLEKAATDRRKDDPASAALLDAALAGVLTAFAAAWDRRQPPRIAGYAGGPPSAQQLLAVYEAAHRDTARQQKQ